MAFSCARKHYKVCSLMSVYCITQVDVVHAARKNGYVINFYFVITELELFFFETLDLPSWHIATGFALQFNISTPVASVPGEQ
jgi:hypothetical protein